MADWCAMMHADEKHSEIIVHFFLNVPRARWHAVGMAKGLWI